ncbi:MAG: hypothetical protein ACREGG_04940 [Candidatus Saccharimonadales bacterium]
MSTSEEVREKEDQPDPLQLVDAFKKAHQDMLRDALTAYAQPCDSIILAASDGMLACQESIKPLGEKLFFKDSDNPLFTNLAITTVIEATDELLQRIDNFDPAHEEIKTFKPGIQPWLEFCITGDESLELPEEARQYVDAGQIATPEEAVETICEVYINMLGSFEDVLIESEPVSAHILEQERIRTQRAGREAAVKLYGGIAMAAFAGTYLANKLQKRR